MTRVDFTTCKTNTGTGLAQIAGKSLFNRKNIKIKVGNEMRVEFINSHLWTFDDTSFIPHGSKKDGFAELQPIWLSSDNDNPNHAALLFLVDGAAVSADDAGAYERIFNIFDGNLETAVEQSRGLWKEFKAAGMETYYWQQEENGRWIQKA